MFPCLTGFVTEICPTEVLNGFRFPSEINTIVPFCWRQRWLLTCSWAAAPLRAAGTADVAAAGVWTTLTPADPNQDEQQEEPQDHQNNQEPVCVEQQINVCALPY